jgi:hypothetical protein
VESHRIGRPRPSYLRALGRLEPPECVEVDGTAFHLAEVFKHDSWAATAKYVEASSGKTGSEVDSQARTPRVIVCKFNRQASIGPIPMRWLGRWLACRETMFLTMLQNVPGIPRVYPTVRVRGQVARHVSAHDFVDGSPLSLSHQPGEAFFRRVDELLSELHRRRIAYVDLHKQENVIVGSDGSPYLIDFQISLRMPAWICLNPLLKILCDCDRYHVAKHRNAHRIPGTQPIRPWIIRAHRQIAVPFRTLRRKLLVWIGVRRGEGRASSELAPEIGLRSH